MMIEGVSDDFRHKVIQYAVSYSLISKAIQAAFDREVTTWCNRPRNKAYPIVSLGCIHIKYNTINL